MAQSLHGQRVAAAVAATGGLLGSFLPWINAPIIGSVAGTAGSDGWVTVVISLLALLSALLGNRLVAMASGGRIVTTLSGLGLAGIGIWKIVDVQRIKSEMGTESRFAEALASVVSPGAGLYLLVGAGVLLWGIGLFSRAKQPSIASHVAVQACQRCGSPMVFVAQYQRWLCQSDPQH